LAHDVFISYSSKDKTTADARLDKAMTDSTHFAGVVASRAKLEAKRDTLLRQVNLIRSIDEDRFIWPHILDEVSRTLPAYTWITTMGFAGAPAGTLNVVALPKATAKDTVKGAKPKPFVTAVPKEDVTFRIQGRTVDIQALTRYMNDLSASPFVSNLILERSDPAVDQGKEIYQFTLSGTFKRPDSLTVHRSPLVVTVR